MTDEDDRESVSSREGLRKYIRGVAEQLKATNSSQLEQLEYSKATNRLLQKTSRRITWAVGLGFFSLLAVIVVSFFLFQISVRIANSWSELVTLKKKLDENIEATKRAEAKSNDAKMAAEEAVKVEEEKGSVQIIAETDPVKARMNPLKVRIVPPSAKKKVSREPSTLQPTVSIKEEQPMKATAIEVPLPVRGAKAVDLEEQIEEEE